MCSISLSKWLPLTTIAVKENACETDVQLICLRAFRIAAIAIPILITGIFFIPESFVYFYPFLPLAIIGVPVALDIWLAERAADVKAVQEYLNLDSPSESAANRILSSVRAAKLLIKNKGIEKFNQHEKAQHLLACCNNSDEFYSTSQLLIKHGAIPEFRFEKTLRKNN